MAGVVARVVLWGLAAAGGAIYRAAKNPAIRRAAARAALSGTPGQVAPKRHFLSHLRQPAHRHLGLLRVVPKARLPRLFF